MHGQHDDASFQRRVELARVLLARADAAGRTTEVPLFDDLGEQSYPITTASPEAQRYFDQGLRLVHGFNHPEAIRAFRAAQRIDPACALCYWGEAYALGPNINAPMDGEAVAPAVAAVGKAMAQRDRATERERALIEALARRYSADAGADRAALNGQYAEAMAGVAARFPGDPEILSLYADALMNRSPWDYWETDRRTLKPVVADLVPALERALAIDPRHPYAIHLYIHAVEASTTPERAEPYADRLAALMPGAGHMVHMPAHIYFRVGRFADSIDINKDAVAADEAYLARVAPDSLYPYSYYPHNVHFLLESARMAGDGATALAAAEKLPGVLSDDVAAEIPWVQLIKAAPYFAHAQFSEPETTLAVADPGDRFPYVRAMWHYARGVAHAAPAARRRRRRPRRMPSRRSRRQADFKALVEGGVPAPDLLRLARLIVAGRIAQAEGNQDGGRRRVPGGGGDRAGPALPGAALLVLPGRPVARRRPAPGRPGEAKRKRPSARRSSATPATPGPSTACGRRRAARATKTAAGGRPLASGRSGWGRKRTCSSPGCRIASSSSEQVPSSRAAKRRGDPRVPRPWIATPLRGVATTTPPHPHARSRRRCQPLVAPAQRLHGGEQRGGEHDQDGGDRGDRRGDVLADAVEHLPRQRALPGPPRNRTTTTSSNEVAKANSAAGDERPARSAAG